MIAQGKFHYAVKTRNSIGNQKSVFTKSIVLLDENNSAFMEDLTCETQNNLIEKKVKGQIF